MDRATEMAAATNNQSPFAVPPRHRRPSDELVGESKKDSGSGKRWSLGSLFRRRRKKSDAADSPDTSSEDEEARSGGFLSRRRSRRDAKHAKKKVVGTFDHVVVNPLMRPPQPPQQQPQQPATSPQPQQQQQDVNGSASPRPGDSLSSRSSSKDWPPPQQQVSQSQQHRRQESSGSGSVEGGGAVSTTRRGRLDQVKARVEASRLRAADSSSDDDLRPAVTTRSSDDSLSLSKRSRGARTERYIRRMEAAGGRWQQQESASASASPAHSPLIRPRHLRAAGPQEQTAATFPPGALLGGRHAAAPQLPRAPPSPNSRVTAWHGLHSSSHDNIYGRTSNYHAVTPQTPQQRSQSFDGNIHRAAAGHQLTTQLSAPTTVTGADDVMVVQFPIALVPTRSQQHLKQSAPPPPPPRDPQRKLPLPQPADPPRPMSYAFESGTDYSPHERFKQYFQPAVAHGTNLQSLGTVWAGGYQRRSGSDNQIQRLQSFSAAGPRPRPNSVTPDGARLLPSPQQSGVRMVSRTPPEICPSRPAAAQQQLQYFADQFPRSRRPIHIQYNGSGSYEQPYLSDSQVVTAKPQETRRHPAVVNATDFWRQKEQEAVSRQRRPVLSSGKPPLQHPARGERSRSNSPHHRDRATPEKSLKLRVPSASFPVRSTDSVSSLSGQSDLSSPVQPAKQLVNGPVKDGHDNSMQMERKKEANSQSLRPLSMVMESSENQCRGSPSPARDVKNNHLKPVPPAPPQRRFSRQSSTSSIEASEWLGPEDMSQEGQKKRRSTNLEDALSELEAIYNSLRLGDDDLLDRAERRDAVAAQQKQQQQQQQPPQRQYSDGPLWGRGAESDSGFNYGYEPLSDGRARRTRAPPLSRRSGVPDIVTDDMAYRRLNPKERSGATTPQQQPVGSYMAATPALAGLTDLPPAGGHPDATLDDVIFRNIRHANNTLRVVDPQPPFGIPIGPVSPAPNSDYLHATPSPDNGYRPNFKPRKIPDVVKDDLAYRNLRKDSQKDSSSLPCTNDFGAPSKGENSNFSLRKKRAVRSLSANLMGLVNREQICLPPSPTDQDFEKAQSLSDLPDALQVAQKILEGKGVIGGGAVKLRELSASPPTTKQQNDASTVGDRTDSDHSKVAVNTSTETLTDSRINLDDPAAARRRSWQQRLRVYIPNGGDLVRRSPSPQDGRKGHPQGKPPPYTPPPPAPTEEHRQRNTQIDENNLEELLNALAQEARSTSESLDRELRQLGETTANIKLRVPSPLQSPNVVAIVERQSSCKEAGEAEDDRGTTEDSTTVPADRSSLHNILSQQKREKEEEVDGEVIRNLSCDGSVTISEIVRRRARERRHSDSAGDQLVPEVLGAAASDEEADREVARATAAAEAAAAAGTGAGTWSRGEVISSNMAAARNQPMTSKATGRPTSASENGSAERVARYKEERRRQLQQQVAAAVPAPAASSVRRYISRTSSASDCRPQPANGSSSSSGSSGGGQAPRVRTTRTSRLRSAAATAASTDTGTSTDQPLEPASGAAAAAGAAARNRRLGLAASATPGAAVALAARRPPPATATAAEKQSTQSDSGVRREKDKSSKRKSNLNRCLAAEAAITQSDDSGGGGPSRRRRRPLSGSIPAGTTAVQPEPPPPPSALAGSPAGNTLQQQQQRLNGTTSFLRSRDLTSRTRSPVTGFVPITSAARKPDTSSRVPDTRQISRHLDSKETDVTRRVEILTEITKESLARLDKLTGGFNAPRITGESQLFHSNTTSVLTNGHSENSEEDHITRLKKSASSVAVIEPISYDALTIKLEQSSEALERSRSPTKPTSSILKKKSLEDQQTPLMPIAVATTQPVSILKRKTSQDEAGSGGTTSAPPVTFSPSVEEHTRNSRRQGILKKRASLDESEVLRRRSCSPDVSHGLNRDSNEFRPILKNQRRSSLEELVRRTQSPDLQPQSILKRKTSRDDDTEDRNLASPEPQGILKRKSNVSSSSSSSGSGSPHVSISQTVLMNVASVPAAEFVTEVSEVVRPILKKKSSSEETNTADSSSADTPKPILKKKTSIDTDDAEERPKKPILKMSKRSSQESGGDLSLGSTPRESPTRCLRIRSQSTAASDSTSGSDGEVVRPILKQPSSRERSSSPRPRLSFCDDEEQVTARSTASSSSDTTRPASPAGENVVLRNSHVLYSPISPVSDVSSSLAKRHSWEPGSYPDDVDDVEPQRLSHLDSPRSLSVAERVLNMESLIDRPGRMTLSPPAGTGAVPKRLGLARSLRDKERFHTQPVTMEELEASSMLTSVKNFQRSLPAKISPAAAVELVNTEKGSCNSIDKNQTVDKSASGPLDDTVTSTPSPDTENAKLLQQQEQQQTTGEKKTGVGEMEETNDESAAGSGLTKSCSVSAIASLFSKKQEEASREPSRRPAGNSEVLRYRERRREFVEQARVATQPVTQEEVEEAVRLNQRHASSSDSTTIATADDGNEDEPSKLSLSERIRLFNQKIKEEQGIKEAEHGTRVTSKRSARFRTQPVTTEEVETAQKKISNLAASFAKPPDADTLGGLSVRAAREKIYEHAAQMLSKSSSVTRIGCSSSSSRDTSPTKSQPNFIESESKPRGILKHSESLKATSTGSEDITETDSESEVKGILKLPATQSRSSVTPELDSFRHLKSVLKKETSEERLPASNEESMTANEQLKSILKPQSKEWIEDSSSTSSEDREMDSDSEKPNVGATKRGIDLITILHNVEEQARKQRQQANNPVDEERIRNLRNLSQEKENQVFPTKKTGDDYHLPQKKQNQQVLYNKSIVDQQYANQKLVTSKSATGDLKKSNAMKQITITNHRKNVKKTETAVEQRNVIRQNTPSPHDYATASQMSDGETSSSGGREVKRIIRNEAVARRRQTAINRQNRSGASSEPPPPVGLSKSRSQPSCVQEEGGGGGLQRSSTQPMAAADLHDLTGASIAQRLAALQKSGSTEWRKRISHLNPEHEVSVVTTKNHLNELRHSPDDGGGGGGVLAERLGKLDEAAQSWRKRVGPSDAGHFTVAGRMQHAPASLPPQLAGSSPYDKGAKKVPRALRFRSKAAQIKNTSSTPTSPQKETPSGGISFKRSLSAPGGDDENGLSSVDKDEEIAGPKVTIPRADDETFSEFFRSVTSEKLQTDHLEIRDEDLDELTTSSNKLLVQKKTVKVQRRNITSRNPVKALAARTDLQHEYIEVKTGIAEKEIRRLNVEKLSKNSTLAVEALAGLASKEDFTAVALKKASGTVGSMLPYKNLMLILVKGRRHVQSRLVEPIAASVNRGDNYVLVTPTEVFNWVGLYSNVIERSRGAEIAQHIVTKKDMGYSGSGQVITISEEKTTCSHSLKKRFWQLLGVEDAESVIPIDPGHLDEDELYESLVISTNKIYELKDNELVPVEEYWGNIPRIQMLDPSKILVLDFGSEMYVWNGKNASLDDRRQAAHLARELWSEGYDYTGCDVCPLTISAVLGSRQHEKQTTPLSAPERPPWALLAKVTQHMETVLFREKFLDWPDFSRVIRSKGCDDTDKQVEASIEVKPCDAKQMVESKQSEPDLELEGLHLGRGSKYFDEELHRFYEISTLGVTVWHIQEYEHTRLPESSVGQFHMGDSYVIRWQYSITITGRELNGQPSRHSVLGRDRCAYFCWQGREASLNEQGAAALLTVELDHERGPQLRVVQGYEPPAFLSLYQGSMVIHANKRSDVENSDVGPWRLFICRGELQEEAVLVEVTCSIRQLRNRGCFVLLNTNSGALHVWYGKNAPKHSREIVKLVAEKIRSKQPPEMGFHSGVNITIYEQEEGSEKREFFQGLGGSNRQLYVSLPANHTPRLFHLSSLSGSFCATEVLSPYRSVHVTMAFPFLQEDLYNASQPALFLLDGGSELWLWQGWWPDATDDPATQTGSGAVRWQAERRAAMHTVLDYAQQVGRLRTPALLVWAGLEPLKFTNLFPIWTDRDDVAELNIGDGRKPGEVLTVEDELARLTQSTYPPAQLLQRPLPDGVDPTCLEVYLDPQHFEELLGMSKEEYSSLPLWKQTKLKKDVGLF